ncbi:MAG: DUF4167 domain-containing protein [Holosporales bacterium]|jgi:hypothetical protein|nr:DUF4167 domain-containing protein [Holosporales bacterium]
MISNSGKVVAKKDNKQGGKGRGHYQSLYDRHVSLAKEYLSSGDHVMYEYNMQHAEHYMRIMNERFPNTPQNQQQTKSFSNAPQNQQQAQSNTQLKCQFLKKTTSESPGAISENCSESSVPRDQLSGDVVDNEANGDDRKKTEDNPEVSPADDCSSVAEAAPTKDGTSRGRRKKKEE